jgi:uncharacterized protein YqhQ
MPDKSSPGFVETMTYVLCIIVSTAIIWYLLLSIFAPCNPCTEKTLDYIFLIPFVLIIAYSKIMLLKLLFPARAESCMICSLIS